MQRQDVGQVQREHAFRTVIAGNGADATPRTRSWTRAARAATPSRPAAARGRSAAPSRRATSRQRMIQPKPWVQPSTVLAVGRQLAEPHHEQRDEQQALAAPSRSARPGSRRRCASHRGYVRRPTPALGARSDAARRRRRPRRSATSSAERRDRLRRAEVVERCRPAPRRRTSAAARPTSVPRGHVAHAQAREPGAVVDQVVRDARRQPDVEDGPEAAPLEEVVDAAGALGDQRADPRARRRSG